MKRKREEQGEVMLEAIIVLTITLMLLIWILGVGFLYYQRYLVTAATNDAAAKIAAMYANPDSDLIMGYIESEDLTERDLYRNFADNSLRETNEEKARAYVAYILDKTNFAGTVEKVDVELELVQDSVLRKHIRLHTVCTFHTPFGFALDFFKMSGDATYEAYARADCTELMDYVMTVDFANHLLTNDANNDVIKMINSLIKLYNHRHELVIKKKEENDEEQVLENGRHRA